MRLVSTTIKKELMPHNAPHRICYTLHYKEIVRNLFYLFDFFSPQKLPAMNSVLSFIHLSVCIVRNRGLMTFVS